MNPYFMLATIGVILGLKRTCPGRKKRQVITSSKKRERVRCKFSGADMPAGKQV
jgi:hypothetical protein